MSDPDIKTLEAEQASWAQTGKDLASGAAGGIAQVLLGEFSNGLTGVGRIRDGQ